MDTNVLHNAAEKSSDNLSSYPAYNHAWVGGQDFCVDRHIILLSHQTIHI